MEPAPSDSNTATATSYIEQDHLTKLQITLTLDDTPLSSVMLMKTSTNTWDKLMSRYEGKGKQMIVTLMGRYSTVHSPIMTHSRPSSTPCSSKLDCLNNLDSPSKNLL